MLVRIYPHLLRYWDLHDFRYYSSEEPVLTPNLRKWINCQDIEFCRNCASNTPCKKGSCPESPLYWIREEHRSHVFHSYPIHADMRLKAANARLPYNRIVGFTLSNEDITKEIYETKLLSILNQVNTYIEKTLIDYYTFNGIHPDKDELWVNWKENEPLHNIIFREITIDTELLETHTNPYETVYYGSKPLEKTKQEVRKHPSIQKKNDMDPETKNYIDVTIKEKLKKIEADTNLNKKNNRIYLALILLSVIFNLILLFCRL